jgi:glycosyltransferase involved in cell wall biosynthesis
MIEKGRPPDYSIIVPAYDEEVWLRRSLPAIRSAMASVADLTGELIVVDNNSSDGTADIAREEGARVVFEPHNQISRARNAGGHAARGRYLLFVDADTILPAGTLRAALENLQSDTCCGGGACISFDPPPRGAARWLQEMWNRVAPRVGWAAGCFVYCLKTGFEAVGGFSEEVYASEELWFSRDLRRWGTPRRLKFRVVQSPRIISSARKMDMPWRMWPRFLAVIVFPPAIRYRSLCKLWYDRPPDK